LDTLHVAEGYQADYYDEAHKNWFANPDFGLFRWILSRFPVNARTVIDVGCGRGAFLRYVRNLRPDLGLVGIDLSENHSGGGIEYVQADILGPPLNRKAHVVVSLAAIEHVVEPVRMARRLAQLCYPDGVVVVMTLDNQSLLYAAARTAYRFGVRGPFHRLYSAHHLQHFTAASLRTCLRAAGLEVIDTHRHNVQMCAVDIPEGDPVVRAIQWLGVWALFALGRLTGLSYLQTVVAVPRCAAGT
jgi:2-polyprenyl-3-methyl-5-hydroxy-6-metoxy-1,4-benzoquinol methylase